MIREQIPSTSFARIGPVLVLVTNKFVASAGKNASKPTVALLEATPQQRAQLAATLETKATTNTSKY
jgi:hypothetical protein